MLFKIFSVIYVCIVVHIDGKTFRYDFRYDYMYSQEIDGWYKQNVIPATWNEARLRCQLEDAELMAPLNDTFIDFVTSLSNETSWTGVHSIFSKGDYFSVGGVPLLRMPITWAPGEPDNYENKEQCIVMLPNGTFADVCCDQLFPYFCYKSKTFLTFNACGTSDPGYVYEYRTGSCYKFHNYKLAWSRAYQVCAAEGAHLAVMDTSVENNVLVEIFQRFPDKKIYGDYSHKNLVLVGVHDWGETGIWSTIHGQSLVKLMDIGVTSWASSNPSNSIRNGMKESCTGMNRNGQLQNLWCDDEFSFICEKLPGSLKEKENINDF